MNALTQGQSTSQCYKINNDNIEIYYYTKILKTISEKGNFSLCKHSSNIFFGRFCSKTAAVQPTNFSGQSIFFYGQFCVILQNFRPAANTNSESDPFLAFKIH
jgi:hypothetical protein